MEWLPKLYWVLMLVPVAIGIYCAAQAVRDFRAKRYGWAAAGAISALVLFAGSIPAQTHAVKLEMPRPAGRIDSATHTPIVPSFITCGTLKFGKTTSRHD